MRIAPFPPQEEQRLHVLAEYGAIAPGADPELNEIIRLARRIFDAPIALVSLVERDRQLFVACEGLGVSETHRDVSFCAHSVSSGEMLVVPDATLDPCFAENPLVLEDPNIRFYAGAPLHAPGGHVLGSLCIIDDKPREQFSALDRENLKSLAALVLDQLEVHRLRNAGSVGQQRFVNIAANSPDGIICMDHEGRITFWNGAAEKLFGYVEAEALGQPIDVILPLRLLEGEGGALNIAAPRLVGRTVELDAVRRDGRELPIELSLSMWHESDQARFGAILRDITHRRANQDQLYRLAHLDDLTRLPNRAVLKKQLKDEIARGGVATLMMIDLDGFKHVNDTLGHSAGDTILKQVSRRLLRCVRASDVVARLGGDEFAILLPGQADSAQADLLADRIIAALAEPILHEGQESHIGASIGIAMLPHDGRTVEEMLIAADLAMYQAKAEGRHCRRHFTQKLREEAMDRRAFESELRRGLDRAEFEMFFQPQVRLSDGALIGAESLIRWNHPEEGLLAPARFLPAVEAGRIAAEVGEWVMEQSLAATRRFRRFAPEFRMGINLFGVQFRNGDLADQVLGLLDRHGLPPEAIELEITENIILRHDATMLEPLRTLHAHGVGIAFDDFGTGYASLSMLKRYPLTRIKIDRSFVTGIATDKADAAVVNAVAYLGATLGLEVVAEGIETEEQRDLARACGCHSGQGYLYGRPVPADTFEETWRDAVLREPIAIFG